MFRVKNTYANFYALNGKPARKDEFEFFYLENCFLGLFFEVWEDENEKMAEQISSKNLGKNFLSTSFELKSSDGEKCSLS